MKKILAVMALFLAAANPAFASPEALAVQAPSKSVPAAEAGAQPSAGMHSSQNAQDAIQDAQALKDEFLKTHGLREGFSKGRCLASAAELVEHPVSHQDYERFRLIAFRKAEARALAELVRSAAVSVATSMEQRIFEDSSSNAASFSEEGKGRSAMASFLDKVRAVAVAKLDALLRENGVDPAKFDAFPDDRKKELAAHVLMTTTTQKALKTLAGASVLASFSTEDEAGYGAVCVVMGTSPELESASEAFRSGRKPAIAPGVSKLEDVIPQEPDALYATYGTRIVNTPEGPALVSYGMGSSPYSGVDTIARYRKKIVAEKMAESQALENAARFLLQSISAVEETAVSEAVRETLTQSGRDMSLSSATEKTLTDIFKSRLEVRANEILRGISTWKRWSLTRPSGKEVVGVVKVLELPTGDGEGRRGTPVLQTEGAGPVYLPAVHSGVNTRPDLF